MKQQLNSLKPKLKYRIKGFFEKSIPYEIRNPSGDFSPYFGQYEGQKHDDLDTNCCWAFAGNECMEDSLEFLWKTNQFSAETIKWFQDNGYIDADGDFYLSRRFIPTISGVMRNGNDQAEAWRLTKAYGAIPNSLLPYTNNEEYFDKSKITPAMYALGREFLTKVDIAYQEVGKRFKAKSIIFLKGALFQSELQIGIPVGDYYMWNSGRVKWNGGTQAAHSVALYKIDEKADPEYPYFIYDQYEPHLKQLSKDYFIPLCTAGIITAKIQPIVIPIAQPSQETLSAKIWRAVMEWFNRNPLWLQPSN